MKMKTLVCLGLLFFATVGFFGCAKSRAKYESAPYVTVEKDGAFEVRDYPELALVRTSGKGEDADGAFMRLFRYIGGSNEGGAKIEMTTPVFMDRGDKETEMSFVLPKAVAAAGAPLPKGQGVSLSKRPAGRYAVMEFSGYRSAKREAEATAKLQAWMKAKGLKESGKPGFAYFDPPWTLGPFRRNEVLIRVHARE